MFLITPRARSVRLKRMYLPVDNTGRKWGFIGNYILKHQFPKKEDFEPK